MKTILILLLFCLFFITCGYIESKKVEVNSNKVALPLLISPPSPTPPFLIPGLDEEQIQVNVNKLSENIYGELRKKQRTVGLSPVNKVKNKDISVELRLWTGFSIHGTEGVNIIGNNRNFSVILITTDNKKKLLVQSNDEQLNNKYLSKIHELVNISEIFSLKDLSQSENYSSNPDGSFLIVEGIIDNKRFSKIFPTITSYNIDDIEKGEDFCKGVNFCSNIANYFNIQLPCKCMPYASKIKE